jgi:hypothetical protein
MTAFELPSALRVGQTGVGSAPKEQRNPGNPGSDKWLADIRLGIRPKKDNLILTGNWTSKCISQKSSKELSRRGADPPRRKKESKQRVHKTGDQNGDQNGQACEQSLTSALMHPSASMIRDMSGNIANNLPRVITKFQKNFSRPSVIDIMKQDLRRHTNDFTTTTKVIYLPRLNMHTPSATKRKRSCRGS